MTAPAPRQPEPNTPAPAARNALSSAGLLAAIGVIALALAGLVYGFTGAGKKSAADNGQCAASAALTRKIAPLAKGQIAALKVNATPRPALDIDFTSAAGPRKLADFKGRTILLNLWATWCAPCRAEMPALDALQQKLGGDDFEVVALNTADPASPEKRKAFLDGAGVKALAPYEDARKDVFVRMQQAGKVVGLPVTMLIDRNGCELGLMAGPADWASDDALALLRAALGK